jgi:PAS domain S-box-containing protein
MTAGKLEDAGRSLAMASPRAAVLVADDEGRFCETNANAVALLKYSKRELLSMHVWDITAPEQRTEARRLWKDFLTAGHQAGVYQVRRGDGRRVTVQYEAVAQFRPGRNLSILHPVSPAMAESRPLDECPFERPFPADFDRCPTSQPLLAPMADSTGQAVNPVWTCEHLSATKIPGQHRYYGRCGLGDAPGRSRWLELARDHHLLDIRRLRVDFWSEAEPQISELIAAKAAVLSGDSRAEPGRRLQGAVTALLDGLDAFAGRNSDGFAAARLDHTKLRNCVQTTLNDILESRAAEVLRPSPSLIATYPLPVQAFLRPDLVAASLTVSASGR